jgi:hypothetical protein
VDCALQENLITTHSHSFFKGMYVLAPTAAGEQFYVVPREFLSMPNKERQLSTEFGSSRPRPKAIWLVLKAPYKITVTGIKDQGSVVEFEVSYDLSSLKSSQLSRCIAANRSVGEAHFAFYDDGWRLVRIPELDAPYEDKQRVQVGADNTRGANVAAPARERPASANEHGESPVLDPVEAALKAQLSRNPSAIGKYTVRHAHSGATVLAAGQWPSCIGVLFVFADYLEYATVSDTDGQRHPFVARSNEIALVAVNRLSIGGFPAFHVTLFDKRNLYSFSGFWPLMPVA